MPVFFVLPSVVLLPLWLVLVGRRLGRRMQLTPAFLGDMHREK